MFWGICVYEMIIGDFSTKIYIVRKNVGFLVQLNALALPGSITYSMWGWLLTVIKETNATFLQVDVKMSSSESFL